MATEFPRAVLNYFARVDAEPLNFRRAIIKLHKGRYYVERAIINIDEEGDVTCTSAEHAPTKEELASMKAEFAGLSFPQPILARNVDALLPKLKGSSYYTFRTRKDTKGGDIIMVQERRQLKNGGKRYIPWTQFSGEGEWLEMEPGGRLPFWKPEIDAYSPTKIMIHEGAKCAAFADRLVKEKGKIWEGAYDGTEEGKAFARAPWYEVHPWYETLAEYQAWGMIGGALAPHRTDYAELREEGHSEVVYICDNDQPGISALQKVSRAWGRSLKGVEFGNAFRDGWDIADPLPKKMFTNKGRYKGPWLSELFQPATYATELVPTGSRGRPAIVLRDEFATDWLHCVKPHVYLHREWPHQIHTESEFNNKVAPFSDSTTTSTLLQGKFASKSVALTYDPALPPGIYGGSGDGGMEINCFKPSDIKPEKGDPALWLEFMDHLIPDTGDRKEMFRWICTLVARPDLRPHWGILAIGPQGVGKGTLAEKILMPLVGRGNCSAPTEEQIVESQFDYWSPNKMLAVVHEIYSGHSSKAYNRMKSRMTDSFIEVNQKYQAVYFVENHIRVFACSNSERALQLAEDDRRWFVPTLAENKQPLAYWEKLNMWLTQEGGLEIIRWWCDEWLKTEEPALHGSDAPDSARKRALIEDSYSPGQRLILNVLETFKTHKDKTAFVLDTDLVALVQKEIWDDKRSDKLERPSTVRAIAKGLGMRVGVVRCQIAAWGWKSKGAYVMSYDEKTAKTPPTELAGAHIEIGKKSPVDVSTIKTDGEGKRGGEGEPEDLAPLVQL